MTEPRTQAGRGLLARHANCRPMTACTMHGDLPAAVAAIEAEALPPVERLAAALHAARYGPLLPGEMHWETAICDCLEIAPAVLALLADSLFLPATADPTADLSASRAAIHARRAG